MWVSNSTSNNVAKWDETGGGYGQIAVDIGGSVSDYIGPGNRVSSIGQSATATATGPTTVTFNVYGKATSGTMTLQGITLSATAVPRH